MVSVPNLNSTNPPTYFSFTSLNSASNNNSNYSTSLLSIRPYSVNTQTNLPTNDSSSSLVTCTNEFAYSTDHKNNFTNLNFTESSYNLAYDQSSNSKNNTNDNEFINKYYNNYLYNSTSNANLYTQQSNFSKPVNHTSLFNPIYQNNYYQPKEYQSNLNTLQQPVNELGYQNTIFNYQPNPEATIAESNFSNFNSNKAQLASSFEINSSNLNYSNGLNETKNSNEINNSYYLKRSSFQTEKGDQSIPDFNKSSLSSISNYDSESSKEDTLIASDCPLITNKPDTQDIQYKKTQSSKPLNQKKTRTKDKYRVVYNELQRTELEKEFNFSKYITSRRKSELACLLDLSQRQIKIWFQNRRAKDRKISKKKKNDPSVNSDHGLLIRAHMYPTQDMPNNLNQMNNCPYNWSNENQLGHMNNKQQSLSISTSAQNSLNLNSSINSTCLDQLFAPNVNNNYSI